MKYCIVAQLGSDQAFWSGQDFTWEVEKAKLYSYKNTALKQLRILLKINPALLLQEVQE